MKPWKTRLLSWNPRFSLLLHPPNTSFQTSKWDAIRVYQARLLFSIIINTIQNCLAERGYGHLKFESKLLFEFKIAPLLHIVSGLIKKKIWFEPGKSFHKRISKSSMVHMSAFEGSRVLTAPKESSQPESICSLKNWDYRWEVYSTDKERPSTSQGLILVSIQCNTCQKCLFDGERASSIYFKIMSHTRPCSTP